MYQINTLHFLNLYNIVCQLYFNTKKKKIQPVPVCLFSHPLLFPPPRPLQAGPTSPHQPTLRFLTGTAGSEKKLWRKVISIPASLTRSSRSSRVLGGDEEQTEEAQGAQWSKAWRCRLGPHTQNKGRAVLNQQLCPLWEEFEGELLGSLLRSYYSWFTHSSNTFWFFSSQSIWSAGRGCGVRSCKKQWLTAKEEAEKRY